jgi:hypothetical protein
MSRTKDPNHVSQRGLTVGARMPPELQQRVAAVANELSRRASYGVTVSLSGAVNVLVQRGLEMVEQELGLVPAKQSKPVSKGKAA